MCSQECKADNPALSGLRESPVLSVRPCLGPTPPTEPAPKVAGPPHDSSYLSVLPSTSNCWKGLHSGQQVELLTGNLAFTNVTLALFTGLDRNDDPIAAAMSVKVLNPFVTCGMCDECSCMMNVHAWRRPLRESPPVTLAIWEVVGSKPHMFGHKAFCKGRGGECNLMLSPPQAGTLHTHPLPYISHP